MSSESQAFLSFCSNATLTKAPLKQLLYCIGITYPLSHGWGCARIWWTQRESLCCGCQLGWKNIGPVIVNIRPFHQKWETQWRSDPPPTGWRAVGDNGEGSRKYSLPCSMKMKKWVDLGFYPPPPQPFDLKPSFKIFVNILQLSHLWLSCRAVHLTKN